MDSSKYYPYNIPFFTDKKFIDIKFNFHHFDFYPWTRKIYENDNRQICLGYRSRI